KQHLTTNKQQPTTNNQQPTTNNQQPTTNNFILISFLYGKLVGERTDSALHLRKFLNDAPL
ncbi:MAG TPA: hypothetical protein DDZ80_32225, partial [Cyanobacteria bacterium UBA8803]|nr:hypothetical protein [Cyanobacteria bacterium UBA8803]